MFTANAKTGLAIGLVPAVLLTAFFVFFNLEPSFAFPELAGGPGDEIKIYGWPRTYCTSTKFIANPNEMHQDEGGVGKPNEAPRWSTRQDIESDDLVFNIIWCSLITLIACLMPAFAYHSRAKLN